MKDNLSTHVTRIFVSDKKSKGGNAYTTLTTEFMLPNGEVYPLELFLTNEQRALITMSVAATSSNL